MNKDMISIYDENNQKKNYKLLLIIKKEYNYLIYTNIDNNDFNKDLYMVKTKSLNSIENAIPITNDEWNMIEREYQELIKT